MTNEDIFKLCNSIALIGWIGLAFAPHLRWTQRIITGIIVTSLCALYAFIIMQSIGKGGSGNFSSLEGVMQLFTIEEAVLAGWIHYLALTFKAQVASPEVVLQICARMEGNHPL